MGNKHTFLYLMIFQQFKTRDKKKRTNMHKSKTNTKVLIECGHLIHQYAVQPNRNVNNQTNTRYNWLSQSPKPGPLMYLLWWMGNRWIDI